MTVVRSSDARVLEQGRGDEADRLLRDYDGDLQAMWPYAEALRAFHSEGDGSRARTALQKAIRVNPHVVQYLLDPETIPLNAPPHFALGSKEEAAYVAEGLEAAFEVTPGALSWLRAMANRLRDRRGRLRREKRSRKH